MPFLFTLCLALFVSQPAQATKAPKAQPSTLEKIHQKYKAIQSLEAEFTQEVYQAALARIKTSKGFIQLQKPNFVRWETHEPDANILVSDGRKIWYFTPGAAPKDKGHAIQKSARTLNEQPLYRILTGQAALDKEFRVLEQKENADKSILLVLEPKKPLADTDKIRLSVSKDYEILEIFLENKGENTTRIRLQNTKLGGKLPANLFQFTPPPGTEVVKEI